MGSQSGGALAPGVESKRLRSSQPKAASAGDVAALDAVAAKAACAPGYAAAPDGDAWALIRRLADEIGLVACPGGFFGRQGAGHVRVAAVATDARIDLLRERAGC